MGLQGARYYKVPGTIRYQGLQGTRYYKVPVTTRYQVLQGTRNYKVPGTTRYQVPAAHLAEKDRVVPCLTLAATDLGTFSRTALPPAAGLTSIDTW